MSNTVQEFNRFNTVQEFNRFNKLLKILALEIKNINMNQENKLFLELQNHIITTIKTINNPTPTPTPTPTTVTNTTNTTNTPTPTTVANTTNTSTPTPTTPTPTTPTPTTPTPTTVTNTSIPAVMPAVVPANTRVIIEAIPYSIIYDPKNEAVQYHELYLRKDMFLRSILGLYDIKELSDIKNIWSFKDKKFFIRMDGETDNFLFRYEYAGNTFYICDDNFLYIKYKSNLVKSTHNGLIQRWNRAD